MALAVVVVGVVGMMQAVSYGAEALDTSRKQQVAQQLVTGELERLRAGAWSTIANLPGTATITINAAGAISGDTLYFALSNFTATATDDNSALAAAAAGYSCALSSTRLRPASATATTVTFVKLAYVVTWTSSSGRRHSRRTESYLGMNGLHLSYQQ